MKLGRIVGTVVSTRKDEKIESLKLYVVRDLSMSIGDKDSFVVAADSVGAGLGEVVLYASGSSARQTSMTDGRPIDACVMAIVDTIDVDGDVVYDKRSDAWPDPPAGGGDA
ncbi:MAG: EutN/CcmL family microcompartment protein [Alphaproteobacteria bacterium]|nr:EutN/CcmL family microcompartment protein [Alphaproteobacteria bacterium]